MYWKVTHVAEWVCDIITTPVTPLLLIKRAINTSWGTHTHTLRVHFGKDDWLRHGGSGVELLEFSRVSG